MIPSSFKESNHFLNPPDGMSLEDCDPLAVCNTQDYKGFPVVISCWKLTQEELEEVIKTKRVWVGVLGHTMPPIWVDGQNPFSRKDEEEP